MMDSGSIWARDEFKTLNGFNITLVNTSFSNSDRDAFDLLVVHQDAFPPLPAQPTYVAYGLLSSDGVSFSLDNGFFNTTNDGTGKAIVTWKVPQPNNAYMVQGMVRTSSLSTVVVSAVDENGFSIFTFGSGSTASNRAVFITCTRNDVPFIK